MDRKRRYAFHFFLIAARPTALRMIGSMPILWHKLAFVADPWAVKAGTVHFANVTPALLAARPVWPS
jgi:hypothetical protein